MKVELVDLLKLFKKAKLTKFSRHVLLTTTATMVYSVWYQRNRKIWHREEIEKIELIQRVKMDVKTRAVIVGLKKSSLEDNRWFLGL